MNILILSVGTRNKIVQYFVRTLKGKGRVVAADCSSVAPALYEADRHYIVPKITDKRYLNIILDICRQENIVGVISLIDPELSLLAANEKSFQAIGTTVIGSSYDLCEMSLDKYRMYQWLSQHGYDCIKSYIDKEQVYSDIETGSLAYPVFVKPCKGSASNSISKVYDRETLEILWNHQEGLMIQEFMCGKEIGVDVYIDLISGEVVSIFAKKKLEMRAGETDKAVSFKDERLFELVGRFLKEAGYKGQIDIDIFEKNGKYFISEVNPRFGGGYPHAYECGVDHMGLIIKNLAGEMNKERIGQYEENIYMMKYNELIVKG